MAFPAGTKFGPYEIVGLIGAGGMGEVHRARDTRLGRDVAIKTLPPGLAGDAERLRRFEIEAKAASLLSHPNIVSIYDIGTSDGQPYIVSELLEGETLRERLGRGPLAPRKAVEIASTIAQALAATHARGIVHRDLKPENLFLTRDGQTKILDFGIAKLTLPDPAAPGAAPTVTRITESGVAIGTLGYMAPEQLRGEAVDHRSDIFALGAILHEAIAGAPAFSRESRVATVNAVLESDPPELPDTVAPAVRRIVRRCLEKNPDDRFQSTGDLAFALSSASDSTTSSPTVAGDRARLARQIDWRLAIAASFVGAGVAVAAGLLWQPAAPSVVRSVKQFSVQPPALAPNRRVALSADGSAMAYVAGAAFQQLLHVRQFDQLASKPLEGTAGAFSPFFSPDGAWIAFIAGNTLKKVPAAGGAVVTICDAEDIILDGSWGPNGQIVFGTRQYGLSIVGAEGGVPRRITTPAADTEIDHHAPQLLADGKSLLFTIHAGPEVFRLAVRSLDTNVQRVIVEDGFDARYLASGHIVYGRGQSLMAAPFDAARLEITGPAVMVVENVATVTDSGIAFFATAADGTLAYLPEVPRNGRSLLWVDRSGRAEALPTVAQAYDFPAIAPDGKRLAIEISDGQREHIFVYEFDNDRLSRITIDGAESRPIWSADGTRITYSARRNATRHLMWQPLDASAPPQSIVSSNRSDLWAGSWTPNNDTLIFVDAPPTSLNDIMRVRAANGTPEPFIATPTTDHGPTLSPDGIWVAYSTAEPGGPQIYVRPVAGGVARQVSTDGGTQPRWARSGRELFYRRRGQIMAVPVQTSPTLAVGKPVALFDDVYVASMDGPANYDVAPDGQRFIFVKAAAEEVAARPIRIVENWIEDVKRRVPSGR